MASLSIAPLARKFRTCRYIEGSFRNKKAGERERESCTWVNIFKKEYYLSRSTLRYERGKFTISLYNRVSFILRDFASPFHRIIDYAVDSVIVEQYFWSTSRWYRNVIEVYRHISIGSLYSWDRIDWYLLEFCWIFILRTAMRNVLSYIVYFINVRILKHWKLC